MRLRRAFFALLAVVAAGCAASGGGMKTESAPPPGKEERRPLTDIDALEHDLAVAEQRLDDQIGRKQASLGTDTATVTDGAAADPRATTSPMPGGAPPADKPAAPEESPPATAQQPPAKRGAGDSTAPAPVSGSPCDVACRALASMKRSAERIAELAGADDPRAVRARERVAAAADRVARAGCACRMPASGG